MTLSEAKAKLSKVIDVVASGQDVVITRMGKPVARIQAYGLLKARERLGFVKGQGWMAADFDEWPEPEARALGLVD